jgi:hypothetical protein
MTAKRSILQSTLVLVGGLVVIGIGAGCAASGAHAPAADPNAAKEADAIIHVSGVT